ncbi:MAG: hypothetical protein PHC52_00640 [Syntrophales bacterium]|nr:hypothetical protein [Syntrophales bacterium]
MQTDGGKLLYWIHADESRIDRSRVNEDGSPEGTAVLTDLNGADLFIFPASWTDEQIREAVVVANVAFREGFEAGQQAKADEIRNAIFAMKKPRKGFHHLEVADQ